MNTSSLAVRLEEFEANEDAARATARERPQMCAVAANDTVRSPPRRLTLTMRRMRMRDSGLRQFRVY
jgi:hypothetical protein